ncbi:MAG: MATE family efflux transporter [Ruminococcus sp.]|uniref:Multidrug export protein MepA n=1 Tax=Schaedlerella arabinosiphila TaxID=2044587 RepID=A0A3R8JML6_9FIRM|nr:MATE family efflux transporter [Schaedlerella arabinosiphila]MCI8723191.1 MATE family efflux transporter [Ruminococcus sp.]MCI9632254.1 MATE family efflux transporter [Ruminococcus sp.]MDE7068020.1 MATE family efflux transporter [Schaedlerella arabinosiphila]RRK31492.1 MATE family efflux transporter [Schaedlerella arabinosiphila]
MRIQLSDHFTYKRLLRFTIPSIIMMICTSVYSIVDGLFVSNYVGTTPFAALNLMMPLLMGISTVGFMIGTGGSALVAIKLGEGEREKANAYFSMLIYILIGVGLAVAVTAFLLMRPIAYAIGATDAMIEYCVLYGRILCVSLTGFMLQIAFQSFFIVAEKPELSLKMSLISGITNVILDYLFIVVFGWGLAGAGAATAAGEIIGGLGPILYFSRENNSLLRLGKPCFDGRVLLKTCTNGSSELMTNISSSIVNILYNYQLMRLAGEDGVAAYGVIMYVTFIFAAVNIGYSIGSAPVVSYNYGAGNQKELKNIFRKSVVAIGSAGITMTILAELLSYPMTRVFVGYDPDLFAMTCRGFRLYALSFLLSGTNIWGSGFFTALGDGGVSALISFLRTLLFQVSMVLLLPVFLKLDGVWLAIVAAESLALFVTAVFLTRKRKKYHYA